MTVYYDDEADAVYLKLGDETPDGVVEISEGVNLDTTSDGKLGRYRNPQGFEED